MSTLSPAAAAASSSPNSWAANSPCHAARIFSKAPSIMIPFTQYLLPDGRKRQVGVERPPDIEALAERFIASGGWFEAEILTTGEVSLTACDTIDDEPQDIDIELAPNGPEVPEAVDRLILRISKEE